MTWETKSYWYSYKANIRISDTDDGLLKSKYLHYVKKRFADQCPRTAAGRGFASRSYLSLQGKLIGKFARLQLSLLRCSRVLGILDPEYGSINLQTVDKYLPPNMT